MIFVSSQFTSWFFFLNFFLRFLFFCFCSFNAVFFFSLKYEELKVPTPRLGVESCTTSYGLYTIHKIVKNGLFLIIKIKHKKKPFFLSPLTIGQSVKPPNIQINNHVEYSFVCFSFNLIGHPCCKGKKGKKKCSHIRLQKHHILIPIWCPSSSFPHPFCSLAAKYQLCITTLMYNFHWEWGKTAINCKVPGEFGSFSLFSQKIPC